MTAEQRTPAAARSMIHVMLDTQVYRASGFLQAAALQGLVTAAATRGLVLHVPSTVVREYKHYLAVEEGRKKGAAIERVIGSLRLPYVKGVDTERVRNELEMLRVTLTTGVTEWVNSWLKQAGIVVVPLGIEEVERAMDVYFAGDPPFGKQEDSEGIPPDLFISEIAQRVAAECGRLHFVTADGPLRGSLESKPRITCHMDLAGLWRTEEMEALTERVISREVARSLEARQGAVEVSIAELIPMRVRGAINVEIPGALGHESGSFAGPIEDVRVELRPETRRVYPGGIVGVDFGASMKAEVVYDMLTPTFEALPPNAKPSFVRERSEGVVTVKELCEVRAGGEAGTQIPKELMDDPSNVIALRRWLDSATLGIRLIRRTWARRQETPQEQAHPAPTP